jgi:hypothetical protein
MGITVTAAARRSRGRPPVLPLERINAVIVDALKDGVDNTNEAFADRVAGKLESQGIKCPKPTRLRELCAPHYYAAKAARGI